jgi:arginase
MAGNAFTTRRLALIGAPTSAGAYAPGQEKAPAAFRAHGIVDALRRAGWDVRDAGDVEGFRWRTDPDRPSAMNQDAVVRIAKAVSDAVGAAFQAGETALILGGDCTIELGTVAGALRGGASVGLVYVDLDTDLNPPSASDGALDWTGVAHLLDLEGTSAELSSIGARRPMLTDDDILFVAPGQITPSERATIRERGMSVIDLVEVHRDPGAAARKAVAWGARFERLLVHVDVDVLSFTSFPIAENVRRQDGLTLLELGTMLQELLEARNWAALTVTEVNPDHAPVLDSSFTELITMLQRAFEAAGDAKIRANGS